eukprot:CAMPEP_0183757984 /NCGR_PEP_ID=MMETSP0739-20130205/6107_1 /TAXON_ID=385413 /ORGANISM="Thalassiosira miniscula, Strain CCMP1093" /LENGTH=164 /DNA_ID=CAMNT_0025995509 /DNA_START=184 /DNA_END=678 /DNA_ORIENTATION=-
MSYLIQNQSLSKPNLNGLCHRNRDVIKLKSRTNRDCIGSIIDINLHQLRFPNGQVQAKRGSAKGTLLPAGESATPTKTPQTLVPRDAAGEVATGLSGNIVKPTAIGGDDAASAIVIKGNVDSVIPCTFTLGLDVDPGANGEGRFACEEEGRRLDTIAYTVGIAG